ncbi:nitroreductase [Streptomyces finlayi]|uniref:Nitroreductase n=1 Tax=Streptomyces finlayi TaxID=67296 RepID=A0A7G7BG07_9ACTN|nr:nitroreductase [Streptomyces finlayi]QNE74272.1 nitroreductase [Streptomyces finlayi]
MPAPTTTEDPARTALALARSGAPPGPDTPAGPFARWTARAVPLTTRTAPDLDHVLRHSLAVTPTGPGSGRLRPAPSAGGLNPVDAHLLVGTSGALPPGRYAYDAVRHRVHRRGPAPADPPDGTLVVLTVDARRTVSHYGHRALPLLLLDAGHAVAALMSAGAVSMSLDTDGALLSAAAGLPGPARWQRTWPGTTPRHPLAAVAIGPAAPDPGEALARWASCPPGAAPRPEPGAGEASAQLERIWCALDAAAPAAGPGEWTTSAARVPDGILMSRRSAPPPPRGTPSPEALTQVLARAAGALTTGLRWCVATGGAHPGLLHLAPAGNRPDRPALHLLASGEARPTLAAWAAGQGWIAEAGAVLLAYGCPQDADAQRIRRDHLAAGYAIGLAQLRSAQLDLTSRPVGSWQGADLGAALAGPPGHDWIVHGLALGRGDQP